MFDAFLPRSHAFVRRILPNRWDFAAFPLILGAAALTASGFQQAMAPLSELEAQAVSLNPACLPEYALRTTLRMLAAMALSLLFTFIYSALAAKNRRAEKVLVPLLDIAQSVPVLGYLSFTVTFFIALFPGRILGVECAAIFAIFTSQAWNMSFSFYQSLRTVPRDLLEVSRNFQLSVWQRFWKLEVPFSMPGLIWNMMMSMSGGWFFIVASEAMTVGHHTFRLPGIGAYLAQAIEARNLAAVGWVIVTMIAVILIYDQCLFRPLVAWADKFRLENTDTGSAPSSWLLDLIQRTRLIRRALVPASRLFARIARMRIRPIGRGIKRPAWSRFPAAGSIQMQRWISRTGDALWILAMISVTAALGWHAFVYARAHIDWNEAAYVLTLGAITLARVLLLILLASVIWVPVGMWIGLRPALAQRVQPLAQFLAAFPANLLFPLFVVAIVRFQLNPDLWLSPLIVLGTQWYILFNVIAGASAYPNDYREAAASLHIRGWQWWKKVMLPGIFPYYVTGAMTASGGAWNASIVSEAVSWGDTKLSAHGLGAYIAEMTDAGDMPHMMLGIAVMSVFVTAFNRLLWRPLYLYAENRLRLD
ncbi:Nitrate/sulfonate/bicarbonate ABC transporter [Candidatus Glomeribacter gigasporarum BEG34]|uniref:Nitrate/sulfonate/bicarbonate ABC transporter n=1 Tax=Candidatus Glomeribacter gigasporarum BEG34 TaxID=1070319 RepID=G2J8H0_9BURK|nr:ABC transporter permease subunit [Candidatus Glomeribacter gigasporarum]CCD29067.1 Nitrate/sulfonate/bicarbonate ABC transporter [Candidatus Glomeribacter gigasporarum BEG34]